MMYRWFVRFLFSAAVFIYDGTQFANAYPAETSIVSDYSNCRLVDHKNGTGTAYATISYRAAGRYNLVSRAVAVYALDKDLKPLPPVPSGVIFDGVEWSEVIDMPEYRLLYNKSSAVWKRATAINVKVSVNFINRTLNGEAVTVAFQGANYYPGGQELHTSGPYFFAGKEGDNICYTFKLPGEHAVPPINIDVTAPDWDLGEIHPGEQDVALSATADRLCLKYADSAVGSKYFIITASNQNGTVNNRYQLQNLSDSSQRIPYQLKLDSGTSQLSLPNSGMTSLPLLSGGKTCFLPTFKTSAPQGIKAGDYSDVLTFNIVTKS